MTMGGKYKPAKNTNPGPGAYNADNKVTKPVSRTATIRQSANVRLETEQVPSPGQYDQHLKPFGHSENRFTMGGKYRPALNKNPGPGAYRPDDTNLKAKSKTAFIKPESGLKLHKEEGPAPGQYDGHLTPFGHNTKPLTMAGPYVFTPNKNPAPGQYDPNSSVTK